MSRLINDRDTSIFNDENLIFLVCMFCCVCNIYAIRILSVVLSYVYQMQVFEDGTVAWTLR